MGRNASYKAGLLVGVWMNMRGDGVTVNGGVSIPKGSEYDKEAFQAGIAAGYALSLTTPEKETEEKEEDHDGQQET